MAGPQATGEGERTSPSLSSRAPNGQRNLEALVAGVRPSAAPAALGPAVKSCCRPDFPGTDQWFVGYRVGFQRPLDQVAGRRVGYYAKRVALMTATLPTHFIDALVTGYGGLAMLTDLCRLYNLRVGRLGTAVLLARVFTNAYLAGRLQESEAQFSRASRT